MAGNTFRQCVRLHLQNFRNRHSSGSGSGYFVHIVVNAHSQYFEVHRQFCDERRICIRSHTHACSAGSLDDGLPIASIRTFQNTLGCNQHSAHFGQDKITLTGLQNYRGSTIRPLGLVAPNKKPCKRRDGSNPEQQGNQANFTGFHFYLNSHL